MNCPCQNSSGASASRQFQFTSKAPCRQTCGAQVSVGSDFTSQQPFQAHFQPVNSALSDNRVVSLPNTYLFTSAGPRYGPTMGSVGSFIGGVQSNVVNFTGTF